MKELISYKTLRILNILEQAIINDSITVADISVFNKCSKTTAYEDKEFLYAHCINVNIRMYISDRLRMYKSVII